GSGTRWPKPGRVEGGSLPSGAAPALWGRVMGTQAAGVAATAVLLLPGGGGSYPVGRIAAVFKADGVETADRYSVSEWWLEPHTQGPGAHSHPEDDVFYVIEGTMSFLVDCKRFDGPKDLFVLVAAG